MGIFLTFSLIDHAFSGAWDLNYRISKKTLFKEDAEYVKHQATIQFINLFQKYKSRCGDRFKWGDEIEYILVDQREEKPRLLLKATEGTLSKFSLKCNNKGYTV